MNQFHIFVIRAILGLIFAVILTRFFYGQTDVFHVSGLTIFFSRDSISSGLYTKQEIIELSSLRSQTDLPFCLEGKNSSCYCAHGLNRQPLDQQ